MLLHDAASMPSKPVRIISLVPSVTELLYHLGLDNEVTAITRFCIHPAGWFRSKTKIGGTKNLNIKRIKELEPDLIIANKEENEKEQVEELARDFNVWVTNVHDYNSALLMIKDIGNLTGTINAAKKLVSDIQKEFGKIDIKDPAIKTAYLVWRHPYMAAGGDTFISDILLQAGLTNVFADRNRYPKLTVEDIINTGCQLIILPSEPYPFKEKHIAELQPLMPHVAIILADGEMFSWYGSRMLQMPQYLHGLLKNIKSE